MITIRPNLMPSIVTDILQVKLTGAQGELWYLNERDEKYYFSFGVILIHRHENYKKNIYNPPIFIFII